MRKKMLAAAAALVMAAVMATSAFAATSSVVLTPPTSSDITVSGGNGVTIEAEAYSSATVTVDGKTAAEVIAATNLPMPSGFSADKMQVAGAFDLKVTAGDISSGVTITVKVAGAAAGDKYVILHEDAVSGWEVIGNGTVGAGGTVSGKFDSLSPIIVLTQAAASSGNNSNSGSSSSSDKEDNSSSTPAAATQTPAPVLAPQTGVNSAETLAAAVVVAGVAVVAFAAKKIKE